MLGEESVGSGKFRRCRYGVSIGRDGMFEEEECIGRGVTGDRSMRASLQVTDRRTDS